MKQNSLSALIAGSLLFASHAFARSQDGALRARDDDENMPGMRGTEALRTKAHIAHGTVISLAIVLFFPLGGIMMKLFNFRGLIWVHAAWQIFSLLVLITGFGLGVWLSVLHNEIWNKTHETFGTVIFLLFLAQPMLGLLQHHLYRLSLLEHPQKLPSPWLGLAHAWFGRVLILLGIINGGIGLQLGDNTVKGEIAYGVVAGLVFVAYVGVCIWWSWRKRGTSVRTKTSGGTDRDGAEMH